MKYVKLPPPYKSRTAPAASRPCDGLGVFPRQRGRRRQLNLLQSVRSLKQRTRGSFNQMSSAPCGSLHLPGVGPVLPPTGSPLTSPWWVGGQCESHLRGGVCVCTPLRSKQQAIKLFNCKERHAHSYPGGSSTYKGHLVCHITTLRVTQTPADIQVGSKSSHSTHHGPQMTHTYLLQLLWT